MAALTVLDKTVQCAANGSTQLHGTRITRKGCGVWNLSKDTAVLVRLVGVATASLGVRIEPGGFLEFSGGAPGQGNQVNFYTASLDVWNPGPNPVDVYLVELTL